MGRNRMLYTPTAFVFPVVLTPVAVFSAVTVAPETTAPLGSVTSPVIDPVTVCASADPRPSTKARHTPANNRTLRLPVIIFSLAFRRCRTESHPCWLLTLTSSIDHCQEQTDRLWLFQSFSMSDTAGLRRDCETFQ